jgi:hypothetical protein
MSNLGNLDPLIVPHWVESQLSNAGLTLPDLYDLSKIKTILSQEDLSQIHFANSFTGLFFGVTVFNGLTDIWSSQDSTLVKTLTGLPSYSLPRFMERLKGNQVPIWMSCVEGNPPFRVWSHAQGIDPVKSKIYLILHPGSEATMEGKEMRTDILKEICEASYVFCSFSDLARSQIYRRYVLDRTE